MVVDGELIPDSGPALIRAGARVPLLTGVARREWAHKKRKKLDSKIHYLNFALLDPNFDLIFTIFRSLKFSF